MPDPSEHDTLPNYSIDPELPWFRICKRCAAVVLNPLQDDGFSERAHQRWHVEHDKEHKALEMRVEELEQQATYGDE